LTRSIEILHRAAGWRANISDNSETFFLARALILFAERKTPNDAAAAGEN
jgi:hypothetical protein